eukprot:Hpha_TRINITY_DN15829_c1_g11::TRINITY_DN15829_c1_g11_i1::g.191196::m.191196
MQKRAPSPPTLIVGDGSMSGIGSSDLLTSDAVYGMIKQPEGGAPPSIADLSVAVDQCFKGDPSLQFLGGSGGLLWCAGALAGGKRKVIPCGWNERLEERKAHARLAQDLDVLNPGCKCINLMHGAGSVLARDVLALLQAVGCGVAPCGGGATEDYVVRTAERFKVNSILGTPTRLMRLAWHLRREGRRLPIRDVMVCGDFCSQRQLEWIQDSFGSLEHGKFFAPRVAGLWGSNELGIVGFSPPSVHDTRVCVYDPAVWDVSIRPVPKGLLPHETSRTRWVEVWENERKMGMAGWRSTTVGGKAPAKGDPVHWTTEALEPQRKEEVKLPPEHEGEWKFTGEWNAEEWYFGWDWNTTSDWQSSSELQQGHKAPFRRRRWRQKVERVRDPERYDGVGLLVLSSTQRNRLPLRDVTTGNVVQSRDVKVLGEKRRSFRSFGLKHQIFNMVGGIKVWITEFVPVLDDYVDWQVEHTVREEEQGMLDCLTIRIVTEPLKSGAAAEVGAERKKTLGMAIRSALEGAPGRSMPEFHLEIVEVSPDELVQDEITGKRRVLVDLAFSLDMSSPIRSPAFGLASEGASTYSPSPRPPGSIRSPGLDGGTSVAPSRRSSDGNSSIYPGCAFQAVAGRAAAGYHLGDDGGGSSYGAGSDRTGWRKGSFSFPAPW